MLSQEFDCPSCLCSIVGKANWARHINGVNHIFRDSLSRKRRAVTKPRAVDEDEQDEHEFEEIGSDLEQSENPSPYKKARQEEPDVDAFTRVHDGDSATDGMRQPICSTSVCESSYGQVLSKSTLCSD